MRAKNLIGLTLAIASIAAIANGCSSAPEEEKTKSGQDDLFVRRPPPPPPPVNQCLNLPELKQAADTDNGIDCYNHVTGYEITVPASQTWCPAIQIPSISSAWYPDSWASSESPSDVGEPKYYVGDGRYCQYPFSNLYISGTWQIFPPTAPPGLDRSNEKAFAGYLCEGLDVAQAQYSSVRYLLPIQVNSSPGYYGSVVTGPNGQALNLYTEPFKLICPAKGGGCDSCIKVGD